MSGAATVELAVPEQMLVHGLLKAEVRNYEHQVVRGLRVQISTKPLKLRSQQYGVGLVNLLRRIPPPRAGPADMPVRPFDLIQGGRPNV